MKFLLIIIIIIIIVFIPVIDSVQVYGRDLSNARPVTGSAMLSREMSRRTRRNSGNLIIGSHNEMFNDAQFTEKQMIASSSASPSASRKPIISDAYKKLVNKLLEDLHSNLSQIHDNIPRPNTVQKICKQIFGSSEKKNIEKQRAENPKLERELSYKILDDHTKDSPCDALLPTFGRKSTAKVNNKRELRLQYYNVEVKKILDELTNWLAVKDSICNTMKIQMYLLNCNTIAEEDDLFVDDYEDDVSTKYGSGRKLLTVSEKEQMNPHDDKQKAKKKTLTSSLNRLLQFKSTKKSATEKNQEEDHFGKVLQEWKKAVPEKYVQKFDQARRSFDIHTSAEGRSPQMPSNEMTNLKQPSFLPRSLTTSKANSNLERSVSYRNHDRKAEAKKQTNKQRTSKKQQKKYLVEQEPQRISFELPPTEQQQINPKPIVEDFEDRSQTLPLNPRGSTLSTRALTIGNRQSKHDKGRRSLDLSSSPTSVNVLPRSASVRSSSTIAQRLNSISAEFFDQPIEEEESNFKEGALSTKQWHKIQRGMTLMRDDHEKGAILDKFRRTNCALQLVILQHNLLKLVNYEYHDSTNRKEWLLKLKNREVRLKIYKEMFEKEIEELSTKLDELSARLYGSEIDRAFAELRVNLLGHWNWLYKKKF